MPTPPDYSRSRAILIGTATYRDPRFLPIPAAANSLAGMRQVLTNPDLCGWPQERVTVIEDPTDVRRLVQTLRRLARRTDEVLLVYFVGHGTILRRGHLCLVLTDTDAEDPDITGLEYQRVREALLDSPARTKIVVLDCCYSGRAIEALSTATPIADSTDIQGVYTLTAGDHTAHVVALAQQANTTTSFTGELLQLIRTGIPGGAGQLTLGTLYLHLRRRLDQRGLPAPNQRGTDTADQFPFTRNAAHHPQPQQPQPPADSEPETDASPDLDSDHEEPEVLQSVIEAQTQVSTPAAQTSPSVPEGPHGDSFDRDRLSTQTISASKILEPSAHKRPRRRTLLLIGLGTAAAAVIPTRIAISELSQHQDTQTPREDTETPRASATLPVHTSSVASMAFSPDGRILATSKGDSVWLWDVASLTSTAIFTVHTSSVASMAFSPDGRTLATVVEKTVRLLDVATGRTIKTLTGHTDYITEMAFSPDGTTLATGSGDDSVRLWKVATGRTIKTLYIFRVTSVVFSPDSRILATGSGGATVARLWDVATGRTIKTLTGHKGVVAQVAFSPDGTTLATGSGDDSVRLWKVATGRTIKTLTGHTLTDSSVTFSPDGRILATSKGESVRLLDVATGRTIKTLTGHTLTDSSVTFSPDGTTLAISSDDKPVRLWRI